MTISGEQKYVYGKIHPQSQFKISSLPLPLTHLNKNWNIFMLQIKRKWLGLQKYRWYHQGSVKSHFQAVDSQDRSNQHIIIII